MRRSFAGLALRGDCVTLGGHLGRRSECRELIEKLLTLGQLQASRALVRVVPPS